MQINEKTFKAMPANLQAMFNKLPNPAKTEVVGIFPEVGGGKRNTPPFIENGGTGSSYIMKGQKNSPQDYPDSGSAARFFKSCPFDERDLDALPLIYRAKASPAERGAANNHPTVKPLSLIQYLVELACPQGGTVVDPFLGSGTTGLVCEEYGRKWIGIEQVEAYCEIAARRIEKETQQLRLFR